MLDAAGTLHAPAVRVPTPYPLPPERLVTTIADIAAGLPTGRPRDRGDARDDPPRRRRHDPALHHPRRARGPRSTPRSSPPGTGCDIRAAVEERLGLPTLVLNDAEVHGAGVISGTGVELVLTLGTGLGTALFDGGVLAPHLELSHAPVRWGTTYDAYIGQVERARLGDAPLVPTGPPRGRGIAARVRRGTGSTSAAGTPVRSPRRRSPGWATTSSSCPTRPASSEASGPGRWVADRRSRPTHRARPRPRPAPRAAPG